MSEIISAVIALNEQAVVIYHKGSGKILAAGSYLILASFLCLEGNLNNWFMMVSCCMIGTNLNSSEYLNMSFCEK